MTGYEATIPERIAVLWGDNELELEAYGWDSDGTYLKAKAPGGGTVEVHVLNHSYFDDHPNADGTPGFCQACQQDLESGHLDTCPEA